MYIIHLLKLDSWSFDQASLMAVRTSAWSGSDGAKSSFTRRMIGRWAGCQTTLRKNPLSYRMDPPFELALVIYHGPIVNGPITSYYNWKGTTLYHISGKIHHVSQKLYIYIYLVAHPTARKWVITPVIYMGQVGLIHWNKLGSGLWPTYEPWDEPPSIQYITVYIGVRSHGGIPNHPVVMDDLLLNHDDVRESLMNWEHRKSHRKSQSNPDEIQSNSNEITMKNHRITIQSPFNHG